MKEKELFDAITNVKSEFVEEARSTKPKRSRPFWQRFAAIAACVAVVVGAVYMVPKLCNKASVGLNKSSGALMNVVFPKAYAYDDYNARQSNYTSNLVDDTFLSDLNEFSYKTASLILAGNNDNVNYSPLSLYYALALAASGANGETSNELLTLLGTTDKDTLSVQCGNLYRRLYSDNNIAKLKILNSIWMDSKVNWKQDFVKNAAENFYAASYSMDFSDKETGKAMGKWISDNTNGLSSPELTTSSEQLLSIINTVYFYGEWIDRFDKSKTAKDTFSLADGTSVNCDFMNQTFGGAEFAKGDGFTRSSLDLKNGQLVFILPDEGVSPKELLSSPEKMKEAFEGGESNTGEVVWKVPKFSFGSELDFADMLKSLGISSAFSQGADFSGITDNAAFISDIRQGTHIGIDENGVEATAFTQIILCGSSEQRGRADMILDRPFIYGLYSDGTLLFVGICENPISK